MESFSLLKYWRTSGVGVTAGDNTTISRATANTIFTTASPISPDFSDEEEGPYFDLEFSLPDDNDSDNEEAKIILENENETEPNKSSLVNEEDERELKLTIESGDSTEDESVKISPDELFLKGNLVSIEPCSEENSKLPVSLLKSATKFRVLLLKLKKSKSGNGVVEKIEKSEGQKLPTSKMQEKQGNKQSGGKFFTVKLKVDEVKAPLVSYFTRDNSSKQNYCKRVKNHMEDSSDSISNAASEERKLTKEVVQKYLNMVKPLYIRVSKRYAEKLKFSVLGGDSKNGGAVLPPPGTADDAAEVVTSCVSVKTNLKQGNNNLQAGLKVVKKHLGKSRSAPATEAAPPPGKMAAERHDDSLLQLQDGIQGAILHCKRSFNGSRDAESSSVLSRSTSDPSHEKSVMMGMVSSALSIASSYSGEAKEIIEV